MRYPVLALREGQPDDPVQAFTHLADPELGQVSFWKKTDQWVNRTGLLLAFFGTARYRPASCSRPTTWPGPGGRGQSPSSAVSTRLPKLRGPHPLIIRPARELAGMRLRPKFQTPIAEERLLIISPFGDTVRRASEATAFRHNRFVAALAYALLIAHASPGGKTERLAQEAASWSKPLYTIILPTATCLYRRRHTIAASNQ